MPGSLLWAINVFVALYKIFLRADVTQFTKSGYTPIACAIDGVIHPKTEHFLLQEFHAHVECIKALINAGCPVDYIPNSQVPVLLWVWNFLELVLRLQLSIEFICSFNEASSIFLSITS